VTDELSAIVPESGRVTLSTGTVVLLEPLKMRQFFRLMRIVTHGAGSALTRTTLDVNDSMERFMTQLVMLVLFSIPDAEQETIDFLTSMCKADGLIENRALNKADRERNDELTGRLLTELDNPDPEDFVLLLEAIVRREAADLQALGKKLIKMFRTAQKVGEAPGSNHPASPATTSSAVPPAPSTSSPASTAGPMTSSSDSPSDESGSVSPPSMNATGTAFAGSGIS
jgi:hypothetical protein